MLLDLLKQTDNWEKMSPTEREIQAKLAHHFEQQEHALYLSPDELATQTQIGNKEQWQNFLNLQTVRNYIKAEMSAQAQIAQRKTFQTLQVAAQQGNVQAAKEINELSGILQQYDNNKVIVLHQISRPKIQKQEETNDANNQ